MIPILYDKNETAFVSNGLGRLRDCISCLVPEERNGIYECDFEYPVNGAHYDEIQVGRIIGVTHEESDDIQPFDIKGYTKPIDGVVTFHCVHVSYRQSYITVTASNINTLTDAFTALQTTEPANPFSYTTDKTSSGFASVFDGLPKSVKSVLGGVEGSILDAYGGEYEWDRFNVRLWSARGVDRNFSIRYGVNMLDYEEELDTSGTYYKCIPYWTDGTNKVVGSVQTASGVTVTGRDECVPLDVSDKFESKPTKAQVEAMGLQLMNQQNPMVPKQNIHVEFVRLQDMGFEWLDSLYECKLCDTVRVVFPDYQTESRFKIVKTVWNVLEDRYESMELGDLSVTLAEALGVSSGGNTADRLASKFFVQSVISDDVTLAADALKTSGWGMDASLLGYVPLGVVGWALADPSTGSGSNYSYVNVYRVRLDGTNVIASARNRASGQAKFRFYAYVLYMANE